MRSTYAKEENLIAQVNFEEKYTFEEIDCADLLSSLIT